MCEGVEGVPSVKEVELTRRRHLQIGELKKIEDFRIASIERISGGQVLSRETFNEAGDSLGVIRVSHAFVPDEATMFVACWCGAIETSQIHID